MAQSGVEASNRHVIGTGTPLADVHFHDMYNRGTNPSESSVFLLVAFAMPNGVVLTDTAMIEKSAKSEGARTMHQFAYACRSVQGTLTCVEPQPVQGMNIGRTVAQMRPDDPMVPLIHKFGTYNKCFIACTHYFARKAVDFSPNIH